MSSLAILASILGAVLIGAISPGPSFVMVSRLAISGSRSDGLAAAVGMGLGGATFGLLALAGFASILMQVDWLYTALRLAGGAYLLLLGLRIWRGARVQIALDDEARQVVRAPARALSLAFLTQISNPKTAVVYASIFLALLPANPPAALLIALPPAIFMIEAGWYTVVALVFSSRRPRTAYLSFKVAIDRTAGLIMGALGTKLIWDAVRVRLA